MPPETAEAEGAWAVGYHDLDGRPGFKLALQAVDGRWYLYVAHLWHPGWSVIDVTEPTEPELLRFVEGPAHTWTLQVQVADGLMLTSLERPVDGWHPVDDPGFGVEPPAAEGVFIWDVETDPADPQLLGHHETGGDGTHRNHYDGGDHAYLTARFPGFTGNALAVLDVSEPTEPREVGRWWWPGQAPDDEEPAEESYYLHGPAYADGDRAYCSWGRVGMVTLDIADPTEPSLVGRVDFGDLGSWLGVHSAVPVPGTDLVAVNTEAIRGGDDPLNFTVLVDVADGGSPGFDGMVPTGARIVGWVPQPEPGPETPYRTYHEKGGRFGPHNQHHPQGQPEHYASADRLVMTSFNAGLRIFDIEAPTAPREVAHYVPADPTERIGSYPDGALATPFEDVLVDRRGYVYCTDKNHGLFVLETSVL